LKKKKKRVGGRKKDTIDARPKTLLSSFPVFCRDRSRMKKKERGASLTTWYLCISSSGAKRGRWEAKRRGGRRKGAGALFESPPLHVSEDGLKGGEGREKKGGREKGRDQPVLFYFFATGGKRGKKNAQREGEGNN